MLTHCLYGCLVFPQLPGSSQRAAACAKQKGPLHRGREEKHGWFSVSSSQEEGWKCVGNGERIYKASPDWLPASLSAFCISKVFVHFSSVTPTHMQKKVGVLWTEMYKEHTGTSKEGHKPWHKHRLSVM